MGHIPGEGQSTRERDLPSRLSGGRTDAATHHGRATVKMWVFASFSWFRDLKRQSGRTKTDFAMFSRFRDGKRESGGNRTCAPQGTTKHGPHARRRPTYARTGLAESAPGWPDGRGHAPWPRYGENVGFCFVFMVPGPKTAKWTKTDFAMFSRFRDGKWTSRPPTPPDISQLTILH